MPIKIVTGRGGWTQLKASFKKNNKHYIQEAAGLAIFMISACFFSAFFEGDRSAVRELIPDSLQRTIIMGILMGSTALFIFYSPWTSPSGSHINPAVTFIFLRLGKMCHWDAFFYIIFQFAGGLLAVYIMQWLMGSLLTDPPVNSAVTIPGKPGALNALLVEFSISFLTMTMVLFTSAHQKLKIYTRIIAACLVCCWVIFAGPVSGFGMNPARSFASALPSGNWTAFWIYIIAPFAGMLFAAEFFLLTHQKESSKLLSHELQKKLPLSK